jgi:hypothetical protein
MGGYQNSIYLGLLGLAQHLEPVAAETDPEPLDVSIASLQLEYTFAGRSWYS